MQHPTASWCNDRKFLYEYYRFCFHTHGLLIIMSPTKQSYSYLFEIKLLVLVSNNAIGTIVSYSAIRTSL